jgi:hypothetical protein
MSKTVKRNCSKKKSYKEKTENWNCMKLKSFCTIIKVSTKDLTKKLYGKLNY